jgi:two-component system, LytTR family, response regulator
MKNSRIRAVAVDDEQHALDLLKGVLNLFDNTIDIVAQAESLPEAINLINNHKPDVVFMDINMPRYSGIQIADFFQKGRDFELIFVTAHGQYAIDALRITAFDYLLKPVDANALEACYHRLKEKMLEKKAIANQEETTSLAPKNQQKIMINSHQGTFYIDPQEIDFVEASAVYCVVNLENGEQIIVSKPLGEFQKMLQENFYRTHRSYIVNTKKVQKYSNKDGSEIELLKGKKIPLSRSVKDDFIKFMQTKYGIDG